MIFRRIYNIIKENQELHGSRTSIINFLKNRIALPKSNTDNYLPLIATLNEAIMHDIDNRIDHHEINILDSCYLVAYSSLIINKSLVKYCYSNRKLSIMKDLLLKRVSNEITEEAFSFLSKMNKIPMLEHKLNSTEMTDDIFDFTQLLEVRASQTLFSSYVIFYPMLISKKINKNSYSKIMSFSFSFHLMDAVIKDINDIDHDIKSNNFNSWPILLKSPNSMFNRYIDYIQKNVRNIHVLNGFNNTDIDQLVSMYDKRYNSAIREITNKRKKE